MLRIPALHGRTEHTCEGAACIQQDSVYYSLVHITAENSCAQSLLIVHVYSPVHTVGGQN